MAHATLEGDRLIVTTEWTETKLAQQVPGLNHRSRPTDHWHGPLSWGSYVVLAGVFDGRLTISPELHAWLLERWHGWYDLAMLLREMMGLGIDDESAEAQIVRSWRSNA